MKTKFRGPVCRLNWKIIFSVFLVTAILGLTAVINTPVLAAAPTVVLISPTTGPVTGGTSVTINGSNLSGATAVMFGSSTATITNNTDTQITATSPSGSGTVDVTVTTAGGTSATIPADQFTYTVFTLTVPAVTNWSPSGGIALSVGSNTFVATPGSVVGSVAGWSLTVSDTKKYNNGFMTIGGTDSSGATKLTNAIQVGMTAGTVGGISSYQTQLQGASGYGQAGTFDIPLCVSQTVASTDAGGSYSITLTYTAAPGY